MSNPKSYFEMDEIPFEDKDMIKRYINNNVSIIPNMIDHNDEKLLEKIQNIDDLIKYRSALSGWFINNLYRNQDFDNWIFSADDIYRYLLSKNVDNVTAFSITQQVKYGLYKDEDVSSQVKQSLANYDIDEWFWRAIADVSMLTSDIISISRTRMMCKIIWYYTYENEIYNKVMSSLEYLDSIEDIILLS